MRYVCLAFGLAALIGIADALPAIAADDTWVSAAGTDSGACAITVPCRTLGYALGQTTAGGTITILTPGRYAPVTITKSVHIMADGVEAIIEGFGTCGAAICIDAGQNDVVSLQGLTLKVDDIQKDAISFTSGRLLHVQRCVLQGGARFGIFYAPATAASLHVFDSQFAVGGHGVDIEPRGGVHRILLDGANVYGSLHGVVFSGFGAGSVGATLRNAAIFNISGSSIMIHTGNGAVPLDLMVDHAVIANSAYGIDIRSGEDARVRMGDSVLSGHSLQAISGSVASYGTNKVIEYVDGIPLQNVIPLK